MKLSKEHAEAIRRAASLTDADIIIEYLEHQKIKNRRYNFFIMFFTILGALGGITAAVASIIALLN